MKPTTSIRYLNIVAGIAIGILAGQFINSREVPAAKNKPGSGMISAPASKSKRPEKSVSQTANTAAFIENGKLHLGLIEFDRMTAGLPESMAVQIAGNYGDFLREIKELNAGELFEAYAGQLLLSSFFGEHPEESWRELHEKCKPPKRTRFATRLLEAWVIEAPDAAIAAVRDLPHGPEKTSLKKGLIAALSNEHPGRAVALLGSDAPNDYWFVYKNWSMASLDSAIEGLKDISNPRLRERATGAVAVSYAKQDPEAAVAWAISLQGEQRTTALAHIFYETAPQDPQAAAAQIEAIPSRKLRMNLFTSNISTFWKEDPAWALDLLENHLGAHNRSGSLGNLFIEHFEADQLEFYTKIVSDFPVGRNRDQLIQSLARGYASKDAKAAYSWLESFSKEFNVDPTETMETLKKIKANGFGPTYLNWEAINPPSGK